MFRDGERRIDYILAYRGDKKKAERDEFHKELERAGLELEEEGREVGCVYYKLSVSYLIYLMCNCNIQCSPLNSNSWAPTKIVLVMNLL